MANQTNDQRRRDNQNFLDHLDGWMHRAILLAYIAQQYGAPAREVDAVLLADKDTIDRLLLERLDQK